MVMRVERVTGALPGEFAALSAEARVDGHSHLERLAKDWEAGTTRFSRPGEVLLAAWVDCVLAGIGGITHDPVEHGALRLRRFYTALAYRRTGIGRALAEALLASARMERNAILVNAAPGSVAFWESLGFVSELRDGHTHRLSVR